MKCDNCEKETSKLTGQQMVGMWCSPACKEALQQQFKEWEEELLSQKFSVEEDIDNATDLERMVWRYCHEYIAGMKESGLYEEMMEKHKDNGLVKMMLNNPYELALEFIEKIMDNCHEKYFSIKTNRGHSTLFCGGTFRVIKTIPGKVLQLAMLRADLIGMDEVDIKILENEVEELEREN